MGADITLNSYGGLYADSYALQSAIAAAEAKGQLFVTAAGNDYGLLACTMQLFCLVHYSAALGHRGCRGQGAAL
jgi:hypothetical protein